MLLSINLNISGKALKAKDTRAHYYKRAHKLFDIDSGQIYLSDKIISKVY